MPFRRRLFTGLAPIALLAALSAATAIAQDGGDAQTEDSKPIPDELQPAVTRAEFLGRQLYLHDRAAWLATDAMLADKRMGKLKTSLGGWVTEPSAHGVRVIFVSNDTVPRRLYEIDIDEGERSSEPTVESPTPLTHEHLAQLRARDVAANQSFMMCAKQYNVVTMPSTEGLRVYLMPSFAELGVFPLGGYHRYELDGSGGNILSSRSFSNGCIAHHDAPEGLPKGATPSAGMFTHLLDPQPTEVHVFVSLYAKVPLMIMTVDNKALWSVKKGRIELVEAMD
jgi:hypothetical protein